MRRQTPGFPWEVGGLLYPERVTLIRLDVLPLDDAGRTLYPAVVDAIPWNTDNDEVTHFEIEYGTKNPTIELDAPAINTAWKIKLHSPGQSWDTLTSFTGSSVSWSTLPNLDPSTLHPIPVADALAAWVVVRDQIMNAIDLPDLSLIFENGIV